MNIPPVTLYYSITLPDGSGTAIRLLLSFPVSPNKTYRFEYTTDGTNYTPAFSFVAVPGQQNYSWSVDPAYGPWPRMIQE